MNTFTIFLVLITIVALLLIIVIMIQNPKGGGLDSSLGSATVGGVQNTNKFLDNSTWTLAGVLIVLILFSSLSFSSGYSNDSKVLDADTVVPVAAPATPQATTPVQETTAPATQEATPATQTPTPAN